MTTTTHKPDKCPVCIVRALTEGEPRPWWPSEPATVEGVVLKVGTVPNHLGTIVRADTFPFVDLWLGGTDRVRIVGYGSVGREFDRLKPTVGDTLTVQYVGQGTIDSGKYAGRAYRKHDVQIQRGH